MKKEVEKFGNAQGALLEKGSGKLTDEERTNYVRDYDQLGDRIHEELDVALEMVNLMENPAPEVAPPTVDQTIINEKSSVSRCREIIESKLKKLMETLDSASTVHSIASLSNFQVRLESVRKMV